MSTTKAIKSKAKDEKEDAYLRAKIKFIEQLLMMRRHQQLRLEKRGD